MDYMCTEEEMLGVEESCFRGGSGNRTGATFPVFGITEFYVILRNNIARHAEVGV